MKKNGLKRILVMLAILLLIGATVAVIIFAVDTANQTSDDTELEISAMNLSFKNSVYIKYAVSSKNISAGDVSLLVWTEPRDEYVKGTESVVLENVGTETVDGVECLIFNYTELAASQMTDNVYARAYAKVDGTDHYSEPKKYSILQYAYNKMGKTGTATDDTELITLLEDMLGYGALAQKYTNYKTDTLATDAFSQVKLAGGVLDDNFSHGLYKVGTSITITAPEIDDGFDFVCWKNSAGVIVSTDAAATVTVGDSNELYSAVYQGNTSDKLEYTVNADGVTYSVSGIGACTDVNIVIPGVVGDKLVTGIADGAFKDCADIKSLTIGKEIVSIGAEALSGCSGLNAIYYGGNEYQWSLIEKGTDWNVNIGKYTLYCAEGNDDWELGGVPLG